ncbi:MAG: hypothetical protein ABW169_16545, partial [Sphingobium sp.]
AMPHMLEAGISSTRRIAASWNLLHDRQADTTHPSPEQKEDISDLPVVRTARLERIYPAEAKSAPSSTGRVEKIIGDALRAAGLLR